jgi:hypothetical protein
MCDVASDPKHAICVKKSAVPAVLYPKEAYPGEPCAEETETKYCVCKNGYCVGRGYGESCDRLWQCDNGVVCLKGICQSPSGIYNCTSDYECGFE